MTHNKQNELYKPVVPIWEEPKLPLPATIRASQKALKKAESYLVILRQHKTQLELLQKPSDGANSNDQNAGKFTLWLEDAEKEISATQERCWALDNHKRSLAAADLKRLDAFLGLDVVWALLERNNYRGLKLVYLVLFLAFAILFATSIPGGLPLYIGILIFVYVTDVLQRQLIKFIWPATPRSAGNGLLTMSRNANGPATEELLA